MDTEPNEGRGRWLWRSGLLLLVLLPLLPEIVILAVSVYAAAVGCDADAGLACAVGPPSASGVIRSALKAAYTVGTKFADDNIVVAWLVCCFLLIILGWRKLASRLLLALGVTLIFAFLPYFGPILAIGPLVNPKCQPNEGGVPPECKIYGGDVGNAAHDAVRLGWKFFYGAPVALVAFVIFALLVLGARLVSRRRAASRKRDSSTA
ncbi:MULTISPECIES: hypothetical protein [Bradyrhizobium]|uniref:Disulfide bond formation protein B n=2 Tax=Bradyrhizobium TaxID=374 RepID=A0ABY0PKQ2_9BRAD|nr:MULTISPECIES: hypothetical protein [Bradyrhizobium]SDI57559.1 hypothetical protein SAMN05444163_3164 [Bradyrhizobium ottawaense]SED39891.1 hypothetical protein SAMN05444171_4005 [Bradyrhizobium lablabi]SHL41001.1 hypothetical protein SAMN05444321_2816 [Bradyrhizobium lablabi]